MPTDPSNSIAELAEAVGELRHTAEKIEADVKERGAQRAEDTAKMERLHAALDKQEDANQKITDEMIELKAASDAVADLKDSLESRDASESEIKQAIETLQAEIARGAGSNGSGDDYKRSDDYKALSSWATSGREGMDDQQKQLLRSDSAVSGGVLVGSEMETFITKEVIELNAMRALARVRRISGKSMEMAIRTTLPTASYEGEAEAGPDTVPQYANETITPYRCHTAIPITQDQLQDSAFDMESEIASDAALAFAVAEGAGVVSGTGVKTPAGFLNDSRIGSRPSATAAKLSGDDILNLQGDIKVGYTATMVFNRDTLAGLRTLRSSVLVADDNLGNYLWTPALDGGAANQIGGMPYRIMPSMPNVASTNKAVAIGDWARAYTIVDRSGVSVIRDDVTQADKAIVKFTFNRWNTGQVTLAEGIKVITIA